MEGLSFLFNDKTRPIVLANHTIFLAPLHPQMPTGMAAIRTAIQRDNRHRPAERDPPVFFRFHSCAVLFELQSVRGVDARLAECLQKLRPGGVVLRRGRLGAEHLAEEVAADLVVVDKQGLASAEVGNGIVVPELHVAICPFLCHSRMLRLLRDFVPQTADILCYFWFSC
jgi:hypothetical protein